MRNSMKGKCLVAIVLAVFAALLVYFGMRLRNSIQNVDESGSWSKHEANSSQAARQTMLSDVRSSEMQLNVPPAEDAIGLVGYHDSIWGRFRAQNTDRFNEILHGFETEGAMVPIDLFVCDEDGRPVPDASIRMSFSTSAGLDNDELIFGASDETGHFSAMERSIWQVGWRVEKEGYYTAYSNLVLRPYATIRGWEERRWFRTFFPVTAVLRRKTPHDMVFRRNEVYLPPQGEKLGFDLVDGKPTPPHGDGHVCDVVFWEERGGNFDPRSTEDWFASLHMEFPGEGNGVARFKMDYCSDLKCPRFAPKEGYSPMLESVGRSTNGRYSDAGRVPSDDYLVVRLRSSTSADGTSTNAIFGKIRGEWHVNGPKRLVSFRTWTNVEVGNRNLEDTSGWW